MQVIIDEVLRYWYSLRLRVLIALDTQEAASGEHPGPDVPDIPDNPDL